MSYLRTILDCFDSVLVIWLFFSLSLLLMYAYRELIVKKHRFEQNRFLRVFCRFLVVLPVVCLVTVRGYGVGADTHNLWDSYVRCLERPFVDVVSSQITDVAYNTIRWILSRLTNGNVQIFFFAMAAPTLYLVVAAIEKWNLKYSVTALFVFYCCFGPILMNQSRQMIAVAILLYAYDHAYYGRWKKYWPYLIAAGLLHYSAVFCGLLIYIIQPRDSKDKKNWLYLILVALGMVFLEPGLNLAGMIFEGTKYSKYFGETITRVEIGFGLIITLLPTAIPAVLFQHKLDREHRMRNTMLTVVPIRYAAYFSYYLYRLFYYFGIINMLAFPYALERIQTKYRGAAMIASYGLCLAYFLLNFCVAYADVYFPYQPFWIAG